VREATRKQVEASLATAVEIARSPGKAKDPAAVVEVSLWCCFKGISSLHRCSFLAVVGSSCRHGIRIYAPCVTAKRTAC
jgi:hypothetical protein